MNGELTSSSKLAIKVRKRSANEDDLKDISPNKTFKISDTFLGGRIVDKLHYCFFSKPCTLLAKDLLGKILARRLPSGEILKGRIVETECYLGTEDKASHSYQGKRTERNEAMFEKPGTAYVYSIYGMYCCFNVSSLEEGSAVLIRSVEPLQGEITMQIFRSEKRKNDVILKHKDLCNGPSKLCQAFNIERILNKIDLCTSNDLWIEEGDEISNCDIITCKRIGIESAGEEWANKPLRFYIKDCIHVSIRNKQSEKDHANATNLIVNAENSVT